MTCFVQKIAGANRSGRKPSAGTTTTAVYYCCLILLSTPAVRDVRTTEVRRPLHVAVQRCFPYNDDKFNEDTHPVIRANGVSHTAC